MANETVQATAEATLKSLRTAINEIDGYSQTGFSEVASIAKLALRALETPGGQQDIDSIAHALSAICARASDFSNLINSTAESVGCNYVDEPERRRRAARTNARAEARH